MIENQIVPFKSLVSVPEKLQEIRIRLLFLY